MVMSIATCAEKQRNNESVRHMCILCHSSCKLLLLSLVHVANSLLLENSLFYTDRRCMLNTSGVRIVVVNSKAAIATNMKANYTALNATTSCKEASVHLVTS